MNENNLFWKNYKEQYPLKAEEITALGINMSSLSDEDSREIIKALEFEAERLGCSIREIRTFFNRILSLGDKLALLSVYNKKILKESEELHIAKNNTINSLYFKWILEAINEEEYDENCQPLSDKSPEELLMLFTLESDDEVLTLQKLHIYHKGYHRSVNEYFFIRNMEEKFNKVIDQSLKPLLNNEEIKSDKNVFNLSLEMNLTMIEESIKNIDNLESLITECNKHMISFYVELDMAIKRAIIKYKMA